MTVSELIAILQTMPQDLTVEVNDNRDGGVHIHFIDRVDCFTAEDFGPDDENQPCVVIQINC
jgi:hypothetical protein